MLGLALNGNTAWLDVQIIFFCYHNHRQERELIGNIGHQKGDSDMYSNLINGYQYVKKKGKMSIDIVNLHIWTYCFYLIHQR